MNDTFYKQNVMRDECEVDEIGEWGDLLQYWLLTTNLAVNVLKIKN
jgi:hypothetical protein